MLAVLTRRHLTCFFRDRIGVLLAVLGALILLVLYVLFLGKLQIDSLAAQVPAQARADVEGFVFSWVFSGILITSAITVPLSGLGILVEDRTRGRIRDFLVTPVPRRTLTASYILAAVVVTMMILLIELLLGWVGLRLLGHPVPGAAGLLELLAVLLLLALAFSGIAALLITLINSQGAMSALASLVGTLAGFLAGAYIPPIALPEPVVSAMNLLPFAPAAMLVRGPLVEPALAAVGFPATVHTELQYGYGTRIEVLGTELGAWAAAGYVATWGLIFGAVAVTRMRATLR